MIRRFLLLLTLVVLMSTSGYACDVCSCALSLNGAGALAAFRTNFVGLSWNSSSFHLSTPYGADYIDNFQAGEIAVRYHLSARFKLLANQPFRLIKRTGEDRNASVSGIGDTRILGNYTLFQDKKIGKDSRLYLEVGAGTKLPTGKYNHKIMDQYLPRNFNPGNGSWGFLFQPNLVFSHKKIGVLMTGMYQYHLKTAYGYRFGNQFSSQASFYLEKDVLTLFKVIPNIGLSAEWVGSDTYANGRSVSDQTGSNSLFAIAGANVKKDRFLLGITYGLPLSQSFYQEGIKTQGRASCQLSYLF